MRALRLHGPGNLDSHPLVMEDLPLPLPGPGQLLIRVEACGVCRTDLHLVLGELRAPRFPLTPGHQAVGRVVQIGRDAGAWRTGQRAGVPWLYSACGHCAFCLRGEENLCAEACFTGFHRDGGFAEYLLAEAAFAVPLPEDPEAAQLAPLLCAGVIGYRALRLADVHPCEHVGLFGFGASAHLCAQVARYWGCRISVFTRSARHRKAALDLGAIWAGGAEDSPPSLLDRAIVFAPAGALVPAALQHLRPGGTLAVNAIHMSEIPAMAYRLLYWERTLRTVANATRADAQEFLALAGAIPLRPRVSTFTVEEAGNALRALAESRLEGAAVLTIS